MSDIAALVADNLDIWTGAIERKGSAGRGSSKKINLYGIERLRALILDLAVRGKLVSQEAGDEPASRLVGKLDKARPALVDAGLLRASKPAANRSEVSGPFTIPTSWAWVQLERLGAIVGGGTPSAKDQRNFADPGQGSPWLTPADLSGYSKKFIKGGQRDLSEIGMKSSSAKAMPAGTVLFTSRAPIGYVAIAANPIATNQGFKSVVPAIEGLSEFVALTLKCFADEIDANAPGTTFKEVSGKIVSAIAFPLPPLAEQKRIVAKVDELMALCDALERESEGALAAHQTLVETLLATLTNSTDPADLATNWARLETHFDTLFTTDASIDALKQTILDLAVRGKLVGKDPGDEPAADLIEEWRMAKIDASKTQNDRRIKSAPDPKGPPFPLPEHWGIQSFENLFLFIDYRGNTPPKTSDGVPLITAKNVRIGYLDREPREFVAEETFEKWMTRGFPQIGDLFFTPEAPLGNICLNDIEEQFAIAQRLICFQPYGAVNTRFYMLSIMSKVYQEILDDNATGMTARGIKASKLKPLPLPVPPEAEQKRIVAKVDELMALCEQLKSRLADAAQTQRHLADAITQQAAA